MAAVADGGSREELVFHQRCGKLAVVTSGGTIARRSNHEKEFNHGVVLTNRPLKDEELFEVRIAKVTEKWAGSVEVGVTTHSPETLQFPSTMTNMTTGTWMVSGSGVMLNGSPIRDNLQINLDSLKVGETLGIMRKEGGSLILYVNGREQEVVVTALPREVYGVVDLYGQCFEVALSASGARDVPGNARRCKGADNVKVDCNRGNLAPPRLGSATGENVDVSPDSMSAVRLQPEDEFTKATVFTDRALNPGEWFEVRIDVMVECWNGSLQMGVCSTSPQCLDFSEFDEACDLDVGAWILTGSAILHLGQTMDDDYPLDLDELPQGSKVAVMVTAGGELHFAVNGIDMGAAASDVPQGVYGVADLYGQCAKITVTEFEPCPDAIPANDDTTSTLVISSNSSWNRDEPLLPIHRPATGTQGPAEHRFHATLGRQITLEDPTTARRVSGYSDGVTFSAFPLDVGNLFEVKVLTCDTKWRGQLKIGVTSIDPFSLVSVPPSSAQLPPETWIVSGASVLHNGAAVRENYGRSSLSRLRAGHRVGIAKLSDGSVHVYLNGEDLGAAVASVFQRVYVVVDIYGSTESVQIVSTPFILPPSLASSPSSSLSNSAHSRTNIARRQLPSNFLSQQRKAVAESRCPYQQLCHRYLSTLALPGPYFDAMPTFTKCYCGRCHQQKEVVRHQGIPLQKYTLPLGWVKFGLRLPPQANIHDIFNRWHVAYYATTPASVRRILDRGELLSPGDLTLIGAKADQTVGNLGKIGGPTRLVVNQVTMTPSIHYCAVENACLTKRIFCDSSVDGRMYIAQVAFKLRVEPTSYTVLPQTLLQDNARVIDRHFSTSELEWFSQSHTATYQYGLLVKLEEMAPS